MFGLGKGVLQEHVSALESELAVSEANRIRQNDRIAMYLRQIGHLQKALEKKRRALQSLREVCKPHLEKLAEEKKLTRKNAAA